MVSLVRRSSSARGKTVTRTRDELVQIACDESGYEGEKLIGGMTDVFAHASVRLDGVSATRCVQELRSRIRSPATEYKANHLLRDKHRSVLEWFLRPAGPLHRNARVYLVEKAFFIVSSVIGLLVEQVTHPARMGLYQDHRARAMTVNLYREGRRAFGPERWQAFLASSNDMLRVTDRVDEKASVDSFFRIVGGLRTFGTFDRVDEVVRLLRQGRPHVEAYRAQVRVDPTMTPVLDPLIPAIVHDRQNTLSERRIGRLKEMVGTPHPAPGSAARAHLADLALVESSSDPRVQLADILAGAARKIASDQLGDSGDAELTALLRPFVDEYSIWGDGPSSSRLGLRFPTRRAGAFAP
jgi:hypothetical protein